MCVYIITYMVAEKEIFSLSLSLCNLSSAADLIDGIDAIEHIYTHTCCAIKSLSNLSNGRLRKIYTCSYSCWNIIHQIEYCLQCKWQSIAVYYTNIRHSILIVFGRCHFSFFFSFLSLLYSLLCTPPSIDILNIFLARLPVCARLIALYLTYNNNTTLAYIYTYTRQNDICSLVNIHVYVHECTIDSWSQR